MFTDPATVASGGDFAAMIAKWGVPAGVISVGGFFIAQVWPKISPVLGTIFNKIFPKDPLAQAGISGVQGVVDILNNQLKSMQQQLADYGARLKEMEATIQALSAERDKAVADAQKAISDLYTANLKLERFGAKITALGGTPPE